MAKQLFCQNVQVDVPKVKNSDDESSEEGEKEADKNEPPPTMTVSSITKKLVVRLPMAFNMLVEEILTKFYMRNRRIDRSSFREEKLST